MADAGLNEDVAEFVNSIDMKLAGKYVLTLKEVLSDPTALAKRSNAKEIIEQMKQDVASFFDSLSASMQAERAKFTAELEESTALYNKLGDAVRAKASKAAIPIIKPLAVERDATKEEMIVVSQYDDSVENLINKLSTISDYVADTSTKYGNYFIGSWLFSGAKNYTIAVNPPSSPILTIDTAKEDIISRLNALSQSM